MTDLQQGHLSVFEFCTKLKTIWDGIEDAYPFPVCNCEKCTCNFTGHIQDAFVGKGRRVNDSYTGAKYQPSSANFQRSQSQTNFTKKPGNIYYYTHCKMNGHNNIERCFKIIGYLPGFKIKQERMIVTLSKITRADQAIDQNGDQLTFVSTYSRASPISMEQYNHLIEFLINKDLLSKIKRLKLAMLYLQVKYA